MSTPKFPSVSSALCYRDPKAALVWLEQAFGFEPSMVILMPDGSLAHSQMSFGDGVIMVGNEWSSDHASPASIGRKNTQTVHIHLEADIDGTQLTCQQNAGATNDQVHQFTAGRAPR